MNSRERLRRCFNYEELDRPGVYIRTGYPPDDPSYNSMKEYFRKHTELKQWWGLGRFQTSYNTDEYREPFSKDFERKVTLLHTPKGDLKKTELISLRGQPGLDETYFIKNREDAERYLSLPVPGVSGDVSGFHKADKEMGNRGIVDISIGADPGGAVAHLFGSENFAMMSVTDRDIIHRLLERELDVILNRVRFALSNGLGPFYSMAGQERLVPPLHGPKDFNEFVVKYDTPIIDLIHEQRGKVHIHCHGSIKKVIQGFVQMDVDVLHPFEAPPEGDILPAEAKEQTRGTICLEGNIQISHLYEHTPEQIREETVQLIEQTFDDKKGLIVCPTASPYIRGRGENCLPSFKAMVETVLDFS